MQNSKKIKKSNAIRLVTYGGKTGWLLRKNFSWLTSDLYLKWQYSIRRELFVKYINFFNEEFQKGNVINPCLVSIETINRCNGICAFCPASRNTEMRPFKKMSEKLFYKIIADLQEMDYTGYLNLYVNNEPLMDTRIEDWYRYAKSKLPKANMLLYTNGTLLTIERFRKIIPVIDKCIINNYSNNLKLHDNLKELREYVYRHKEYQNKDITIQIRYINEILTNRAGSAPNKKKKFSKSMICIMPYTDMTVYPNGIIGLCCSDALEQTNLGNVNDSAMKDIWSSEKYKLLRTMIGNDRNLFEFCRGCDFVDAGIRNGFIREVLKNRQYSKLHGL